MVRLSSGKLAHCFEADDMMNKQSMSSGLYDLEDYSDEQNAYSDKMSIQDTFDGSLATDEGSVVDAKDNPTQLYLRLHYRLWDMVITTLKNKPQDASVWIVKSNGENKVLPIHVACESTSCPPTVVEALMEAYPQALQCPTTRNGSLPLHLVCANEYFLSQHESLIMRMVNVSPRTLTMSNHRNETPTDVLKKHLCSSETKSIRQCQQLLVRMEEKIVQADRQPSDQNMHTPRIVNKTVGKGSILQTPSTDATDDGFASRLNKMRMNTMPERVEDDKVDDVSVAYRPSTDSHLHQAQPLEEEDDRRDYISPSMSRGQTEGNTLREEALYFDESSSEEELSQISPRSISHAKLKLAKTVNENCLLRKQLSQLTKKHTSLQSHHDSQSTLINNLKSSVDQERDISKTHVKDYELKLARLQDHLLDTQRQLQIKSRNESSMAQRISQLESSIAGKKADLFTVKAALQDEAMSKSSLEEDLEATQSQNKKLKREVVVRTKEQERLLTQLEDVTKELETYKEIDSATKKNLAALDATFREKEIQVRSLTESVGAGEKKYEKLEKFNNALKTKANDLKDALRNNTETFKATVAKLESELQKKEKAEFETLKQVEELKRVFEAKDKKLELLASERQLLESTCETLREKEIIAEGISKKLAEVSLECTELQAKLKAKNVDIERLAGEIAGLETESALKSGTINENDRRMEALYTELVAQRKRETGLDQKNKDLSRRFDDLTRDQQSKSTKLKILKSAVESYKIEMEQFVVMKSGDDKQAAENIKKLLRAEEQMAMETAKIEELKSKLVATEQREHEERSLADEQRITIQEMTAKLERRETELEKIQNDVPGLTEKSEQLERLRMEHMELAENAKAKEAAFTELKTLCDQKIKSDEASTTECTKLREHSKLQASLVEDLEISLCELKSKHTALCEEYERTKIIAEKRQDLNASTTQEHDRSIGASSARIKELHGYISELKEEKLQGTKRIDELEVEVNDLRKSRSIALSRVAELESEEKGRGSSALTEPSAAIAQKEIVRMNGVATRLRKTAVLSDDAISRQRKANNTLREEIKLLKVEAAASDDTIKALRETGIVLQQEIETLRGTMQQKDTIEIDALELLTTRNCQNLLHINDLSNEKERLTKKVADLDSALKTMGENYDDLRGELAENSAKTEDTERKRVLQVRSYEDQIGLLDQTIYQLRATLDEQHEVVTLKLSMSSEVAEERTLLKKAVDSLTSELQSAQRKCVRLEAHLEQSEKERDALRAKMEASEEAASVSYEVDRQEEQKKMMDKIDSLSQSLRSSMDRSIELQKRAEELKTLQSQKDDSQDAIASLKESIDALQKELDVKRKENERSEELNKSYQIEVGRLLKANTAYGEECQEINLKSEKQKAQLGELRQCKANYEKQSVASSMKLLDILSKFTPQNVATKMMQQKEELEREYEKLSEDNTANSANVEYLVQNIQLLETRVMELTSTHKLLLQEAEGLRNTINEQNERVLELEDLIRLNEAPGSPTVDDSDDADGAVLNAAASVEWDRQIIDLVSRYTGSFSDKESLLKKAENRTATRETLRLRVNDAFESQSSKIATLHDHVKKSETKATEFQKNLKEIRSANQTLKLENKILKTAGKERDQRATKTQAKLKEENESLKQSISKLTQQTADHQLKIRRLAIKQASLQRKKEAARNHDKTKVAESLKVAAASASEDMGSLAFSADSQDATDNSAHPIRASSPAARRGSASHDRSVEVVLVDESSESRDDHTPS